MAPLSIERHRDSIEWEIATAALVPSHLSTIRTEIMQKAPATFCCGRGSGRLTTKSRGAYLAPMVSSSTTAPWDWASFRMSSLIRIEQNLGPHIEQNFALLKVS